MANNRVFYASHGVALAKETGDTSLASPIYNRSGTVQGLIAVAGANSVTMNTNFNLEQVFQLGQLEIYQDVEEVPDIEISIEKVLDDNPTAYQKAIGQSTVVSGVATTDQSSGGSVLKLTEIQNNKCDAYLTVHPDSAENAGDFGDNGDVESFVWCSGMYVSSVSFNFPTDGNFTESVTLVGNHKQWYAGGAS